MVIISVFKEDLVRDSFTKLSGIFKYNKGKSK